MNILSNKLLRVLLFAVLLPGILGCAAFLLLSAADLIVWIQADVYDVPAILESLLVRTVDALAFLPVLLLFIGVCIGQRNGKHLQSLYTVSVACSVLLDVAAMLTGFLTGGIPAWETVLRQSAVFLPMLCVAADTLLSHRFLIPSRIGALVMTVWEIRGIVRFQQHPEQTIGFLTDSLSAFLTAGYWLAVTVLVFGQVVYYSHAVYKKIRTMERTLAEAKRAYEKGNIPEAEYTEIKAQIMKYL